MESLIGSIIGILFSILIGTKVYKQTKDDHWIWNHQTSLIVGVFIVLLIVSGYFLINYFINV